MIDTSRVRALAAALDNSPVTELVLQDDGTEIHFRRDPATFLSSDRTPREPVVAVIADPQEHAIVSRRVGIYHKPQRPVHPGDRIEVGEIVGCVEAMRILNEIVAEIAGVVMQVFVEDGSPVEYGQELFLLKEVLDEPGTS